MATIFLTYGHYEEVNTVIDEIPNEFELDEIMEEEYEMFSYIMDKAINILGENLYEDCLDDDERSSLLNIYTVDKPIVSALALSLLKRDNPEFVYSELVYNIGEELPMAPPSGFEFSNIEDSRNNDEFLLYPNPAFDFTTLKYNANYLDLSYSISDMTGSLVKQSKLETIENLENHEVLIDLRKLSPGTYYFKLKTNSNILYNAKLIITK